MTSEQKPWESDQPYHLEPFKSDWVIKNYNDPDGYEYWSQPYKHEILTAENDLLKFTAYNKKYLDEFEKELQKKVEQLKILKDCLTVAQIKLENFELKNQKEKPSSLRSIALQNLKYKADRLSLDNEIAELELQNFKNTNKILKLKMEKFNNQMKDLEKTVKREIYEGLRYPLGNVP